MKKRLLLQLLAIVCAVSSYAYGVEEYVFTATAKFKTQGENLISNGDFSSGSFEGFSGTDLATPVDASVWSFVPGLGPNGESVAQSLGTTTVSPFTRAIPLTPGVYVVSYWIKGTAVGTTSVTAGTNNYADFFINSDMSLTKGDGARGVATKHGFSSEWTEAVDTFTVVEDGQYLIMNFAQFETDVAFTNISVNPAMEVYDNRILQRKLAYIDALIATGKFVNDTENGFLGIVEMIRGFLEEPSALDDKAGIEDMLASFDVELTAWLNANSADILKGKKRWDSYGDTRKQNAIGEGWSGSGGRWCHKNNGGGDGDEIGHRLQGGMGAGSATQYYTINPLTFAGTYMFAIETQGYYMVSKSENYTPDYITPFEGATYYVGYNHLGGDSIANNEDIATGTVKAVYGDNLANQYYKTILVTFDVLNPLRSMKVNALHAQNI